MEKIDSKLVKLVEKEKTIILTEKEEKKINRKLSNYIGEVLPRTKNTYSEGLSPEQIKNKIAEKYSYEIPEERIVTTLKSMKNVLNEENYYSREENEFIKNYIAVRSRNNEPLSPYALKNLSGL